MRRVGVTGGRDYDDAPNVALAIMFYCQPGDVLVSGHARGADTLAEEAARFFELEVETHPADWQKYGKRAGFIRNEEMVYSGLDLLIAFPGGNGTADMVRRARQAGIRVVEVTDSPGQHT
jgi:YspA, cpYpsA-related SLOG family